MDNVENKGLKAKIFAAKAGLAGIAGMAASLLGIASTHAAMSGVTLTSSVITGAKAGFADTVDTLQTTANNQYLFEFALMFVGASIVVGIILWAVKGHRHI